MGGSKRIWEIVTGGEEDTTERRSLGRIHQAVMPKTSVYPMYLMGQADPTYKENTCSGQVRVSSNPRDSEEPGII